MAEQGGPANPQEWLRRARSNLQRARTDIAPEGVYLEDLCFDAQQAAEKAIKAVLIHRDVPFPFVHDLVALLGELQADGLEIPAEIREAGRLNRYAVAARYPGTLEPVSAQEHQAALSIASTVVDWAERQL